MAGLHRSSHTGASKWDCWVMGFAQQPPVRRIRRGLVQCKTKCIYFYKRKRGLFETRWIKTKGWYLYNLQSPFKMATCKADVTRARVIDCVCSSCWWAAMAGIWIALCSAYDNKTVLWWWFVWDSEVLAVATFPAKWWWVTNKRSQNQKQEETQSNSRRLKTCKDSWCDWLISDDSQMLCDMKHMMRGVHPAKLNTLHRLQFSLLWLYYFIYLSLDG